jgi:cytochrome c553
MDLRYPGTQTIAAIHAMLGPARGLGDNAVLALADHFAAQKPTVPNRPAAQRAAGARLYGQGRGTEIPGCAGCHGANGEGIADAPRLAGQNAAYLEDQLEALMLTARSQRAMNKHAWAMRREDMRSLAAFLAHDPR